MDPTSIAIAAVTYVAGELAGTGLKELGKDLYGKFKELWKSDEMVKLDLFEKYPKSEDIKTEVSQDLAKRLEENPDIAKEFEGLVKQIPAVQIKQNTTTITGDHNLSFQDTSNSTFNLNQKSDD
jgi:hypothetical protein